MKKHVLFCIAIKSSDLRFKEKYRDLEGTLSTYAINVIRDLCKGC